MELLITIANGKVSTEVSGAVGKECDSAAAPYESALSSKKPDKSYKAEARGGMQQQQIHQNQQQQTI